MIEEPQSAFYAWIAAHESSWQESLRAGQVILVCDVGGGTTDFTLIVVEEGKAGLRFERVAVGDHLLLGGDNMDLALARRVEERLTGKAGKLEPAVWAGLVHAARLAKEALLADEAGAPERAPITLLGQSTRVVGGAMRDELSRTEVEEAILSGFFPLVPPGRGAGAAARRHRRVRIALRVRSGGHPPSRRLPPPASGRGGGRAGRPRTACSGPMPSCSTARR